MHRQMERNTYKQTDIQKGLYYYIDCGKSYFGNLLALNNVTMFSKLSDDSVLVHFVSNFYENLDKRMNNLTLRPQYFPNKIHWFGSLGWFN